MAASVRHPNLASIFHLGATGEHYFYAMQFIEGETLECLIKCADRLDVPLALEMAAPVAAGLTAVHKQKLVHRDIKPSNIMVSFGDAGEVTAKLRRENSVTCTVWRLPFILGRFSGKWIAILRSWKAWSRN